MTCLLCTRHLLCLDACKQALSAVSVADLAKLWCLTVPQPSTSKFVDAQLGHLSLIPSQSGFVSNLLFTVSPAGMCMQYPLALDPRIFPIVLTIYRGWLQNQIHVLLQAKSDALLRACSPWLCLLLALQDPVHPCARCTAPCNEELAAVPCQAGDASAWPIPLQHTCLMTSPLALSLRRVLECQILSRTSLNLCHKHLSKQICTQLPH